MFEPHRAEAVMKKRITYSMVYRAAVEAAARQQGLSLDSETRH
jgi:hypothetical protein